MRTTLTLDDDLVAKAIAASGRGTPRRSQSSDRNSA